jgi:hypothetical protein
MTREYAMPPKGKIFDTPPPTVQTMAQALGIILLAAIIWAAAHWGEKLLRSKTESARRARIVVGSLLAAGLSAMWYLVVGPVGLAATLAGIGAVVWIARGTKS